MGHNCKFIAYSKINNMSAQNKTLNLWKSTYLFDGLQKAVYLTTDKMSVILIRRYPSASSPFSQIIPLFDVDCTHLL